MTLEILGWTTKTSSVFKFKPSVVSQASKIWFGNIPQAVYSLQPEKTLRLHRLICTLYASACQVGHLGRIVLVVLNQTDEKTLSAAELEKVIREQVNSSEIPQHCSVEKITVLEEALSPIRIYV